MNFRFISNFTRARGSLVLLFLFILFFITFLFNVKASSPNIIYENNDTKGRILITRLDKSFIKETNELQSSFSRILFWKDSLADIKRISLHSDIIQRNNALLSYFTKDTDKPAYKSIHDFSIIMSAFIQNYFVHFFSPIIDGNIYLPPNQKRTLKVYEKTLFPWLKITIISLYRSFNGRGIVILTGMFHFNLAFMLVKTLREVLKSDLPIEIMYGNDQDLSIEKRNLISQFKDVVCVNIEHRFIASKLPGVNGWWLKAYSILLSSFAEPIFMDADVLFVVDPSTLFEHPLYLKYGTLLFKDRQIHLGNDYKKLMGAFPFASDTLKNTGLWKKTTTHELESGVLVYNKKSYSSFFALLAACNLASDPMQHIVSTFFHGDKETFWMGFELLHLPWQLMSPYGANVGISINPSTICGSLAHSDEQGNLLWLNGGVAVDKTGKADEIYDFQYYSTDDIPDKIGRWIRGERWCWKSVDPTTQVKKLSEDKRKLFKKYVSFYKDIRNGTFHIES